MGPFARPAWKLPSLGEDSEGQWVRSDWGDLVACGYIFEGKTPCPAQVPQFSLTSHLQSRTHGGRRR